VGREPLQQLSKAQQKVVDDIYEEIENAIPIQLTPLQEQKVKTEIAEELQAEEEEIDMDIDEFLIQLNLGFPENEEEEAEEEEIIAELQDDKEELLEQIMEEKKEEIIQEISEAIVEERKETVEEMLARISEEKRVEKEKRAIKKAEEKEKRAIKEAKDAKNYLEFHYQRYLQNKGTSRESDWASPINIAREKAEAEAKLSGKGLLLGGALSINHIKKMLKASYQDAPEKIDNFILDHGLSGQYGVVYFNPITGQAVVVHRGTKEAMDWTNNFMYAIGSYKKTDRYKIGKKMQELAEKKYGAKNISTLGHSQGAILARDLGQNTKEIITLNPAYKGEKPLKNEYNIRSSGDVVSAGLWGTKRGHDLIIPSKGFNVLGEHMIDILDRVDQNKMVGH